MVNSQFTANYLPQFTVHGNTIPSPQEGDTYTVYLTNERSWGYQWSQKNVQINLIHKLLHVCMIEYVIEQMLNVVKVVTGERGQFGGPGEFQWGRNCFDKWSISHTGYIQN